jgi:hypothetical protein
VLLKYGQLRAKLQRTGSGYIDVTVRTRLSDFASASDLAHCSVLADSSNFTGAPDLTYSSKFTHSSNFAGATEFTHSSKFTHSSNFAGATEFTNGPLSTSTRDGFFCDRRATPVYR